MNKLLLLLLFVTTIAFAGTPDESSSYAPFEFPDQACMLLAVKCGDTITLPIVENPTTGYSWELSNSNPTALTIVSAEYTQPKQKEGELPLCGAPGVKTFVLKAAQAGSTTLLFKYRRAWEKDVPPAKQVTIFVTIQK